MAKYDNVCRTPSYNWKQPDLDRYGARIRDGSADKSQNCKGYELDYLCVERPMRVTGDSDMALTKKGDKQHRKWGLLVDATEMMNAVSEPEYWATEQQRNTEQADGSSAG